MKKFWTYLLISLWAMVLLLTIPGCKKDKPEDPNAVDYTEINDWILENMEIWYFWNDRIPRRTDKKLPPADYFESLLYKDDRFSWIQDNYIELINSLSGVNTEAGYEFELLRMSETSSDLIGCISYIKSGTPAEVAGLKRGDYFLEINRTQLTIENYTSLIEKMDEPHTFGKAILSGNTITGMSHISLSVIENYKENPILLDTIYHIQDKKIGYFVYNFFARDSEMLGIAYEKELNDLFGKFKTEGIDDLIIDLRYNSGGSVATAIALSSMISNRSSTDVFGYEEYNSVLDEYLLLIEGSDYNVSYFLDEIERYDNNNKVVERVPINKLSGLSRVYFIVTRRTASASELVINALRPYMDDDKIILIGEKTYGKNVGSVSLYERDPVKQKTNTWGMQPIVLKLSNSEGFSDYGNGFTPKITQSEFEELELKPLGDTDEILLSATLDELFGKMQSIQRTNSRKIPEIVGSSIDRTPARKNMYIEIPRKLLTNEKKIK
jgi:C-terminal processing protease CtpA/Prc